MLDPQFNIEFLHQTLKSSCWCEIRGLDLLPFTRLGAGGRSYITQGASDQVLAAEHASGHRPYGQNLQSGSSAGASGQRDMSKIICHYCKKPGHMIADSRKRQNANSSTVRHSSSCCSPETPTESETYQSPYSIGPLQHYFYDLRSTPTPDTDSFTPRQRKQIHRLNPSCHISSSSATGICSPYAYNIGAALGYSGELGALAVFLIINDLFSH